MKPFLLVIFTGLFIWSCQSKSSFTVPGQGSSFPLHTAISPAQYMKYDSFFIFENPKLDSIRQLRKTLLPLVTKGDPLAQFLYAKCYDLYTYGEGKPEEAKVALTFYRKAAEQKMAGAEYLLADLYRLGLMDIPVNFDSSLLFLKRSIEHGDPILKSRAYFKLSGHFMPDDSPIDIPFIKRNEDSAMYYLNKAFECDPTSGAVIDELAGLYEEKGNFQKALELYIKSDNDASNLTAAEWLLKGNHVPRDVDRALEIVYKLSEKEIAQYGSFENAIKLRTDFSNSPIFILNEWYTCKKLITLEQLGKYRLEWFTYAGYCDECQSCL